ncbi:MAG TPA: ABC transporter ATP-binding protein, partial [Geminicoccaceae bacterium]
ASPLKIAGRPRGEIQARVKEVARLLRIDHLLDRLPAELSGGQQQRTAIGRALAREADLLLLDEPLVNLDYKLREELRNELSLLFATGDSTVVYATTEPHEALLLGGRTAVMDEGRVLQAGPTLDVFHRPASTAVARVFSDPPVNMIGGEVVASAAGGGEVRLAEGSAFPAPPHLGALPAGAYRFGVRANHLGVVRRLESEIGLPAEVTLAEVNGSETFIHARHAGHDLVVQEEGIHTIALGTPIGVYLDPSRLFAFAPDGSLAAAPRGLVEAAQRG